MRVAAQLAVARAQVLDFIVGQRQAQARVGGLQGVQRDRFKGAGRLRAEQRGTGLAAGQQRLRHRVVQQLGQRGLADGIVGPAGEVDAHAALDPAHRQPGTAQQLGGLARPWRERAQARHHEAAGRLRRGVGGLGLRLQDAAQRSRIGRCARVRLDPVPMPGAEHPQAGDDRLEAGLQAVAAERRQGGRALEDDHVRQHVESGRTL